MEVLEQAGFRVGCPSEVLCCGRPLYDFGMLSEAKRYLERIMDALGPDLDAGLPIVVLEPSCASVFRDELRNLVSSRPARNPAAPADIFAKRIPAKSSARLRSSDPLRKDSPAWATAITKR